MQIKGITPILFSLLLLTPVINGCEDREREELRMFRTKAENLLRENSILEKRNERLKELVKKLRRERNALHEDKERLAELKQTKAQTPTSVSQNRDSKPSKSSSKLRPTNQTISATLTRPSQNINTQESQATTEEQGDSERSRIKKSSKKRPGYQLISPIN